MTHWAEKRDEAEFFCLTARPGGLSIQVVKYAVFGELGSNARQSGSNIGGCGSDVGAGGKRLGRHPERTRGENGKIQRQKAKVRAES